MSDISIAESKIQILFLVDRAPGVSYHLLMEKCMEMLYSDFFTFSRAYEELIAGNLMDKSKSGEFSGVSVGSTETLTLTDGGRAFSATITVDDEETASKLCKMWKNNCSKASDGLIRLITES